MSVIVTAVILFLIFKLFYRPYRLPIAGIYKQKYGFYPLKYLMMYTILKLRQLSIKRSRKKELDAGYRDEFEITEKDRLMDVPQPLHDNPKAIDAVYFNGSSKNGAALVCGVARRPEGLCNAFLYLRVNGGDLFLSPKLPDTTLYQIEEEKGKYMVEGLNLYTVEPMKTWKIEYNGVMKYHNNPQKSVNVKVDAFWKTKWNHFNYDCDMSPSSMASDMAHETWSREYFQTLKDVHQTHYEQHGNIQGIVKIDNDIFNIDIETVRDHSFGKLREWKNFHRYALHYIALENGDRISLGKICMPVCFSGLTIGFVCRQADGQMYNVDSCNLELFRHGENLSPPLDYAFQFEAGGILYTVRVDVTDSPRFFIGPEHESCVVERLAKFTVNGVKGWGAAEWQYRNMDKNIIEK